MLKKVFQGLINEEQIFKQKGINHGSPISLVLDKCCQIPGLNNLSRPREKNLKLSDIALPTLI